MRIHFFTVPFYFAFIWFRVQGSGVRWRLRRLFLEDGILVSQLFPLGEGLRYGGAVFSFRCLPHAGKALSIGIVFPHMHVFALSIWG